MTNDINSSQTDTQLSPPNSDDMNNALNTNNVNIQQQKQQIAHNKLKQYETDMSNINSGCLYQLLAPFMLLFGIVPSQQSVVDVKPPTRDETSSLLIGDNSDSEDDYDLYNNPSNIDKIDESRIIRQEKTILDHEHGGLSHHDELESYLNQSLENTTTVLHKDEQTVYSKFKDTSYRNIHREDTTGGEIPRQTQSNLDIATQNANIIESQQDKFMEVMNQFNINTTLLQQSLQQDQPKVATQPSTSTNTPLNQHLISKKDVVSPPNQTNISSNNNTVTATTEPIKTSEEPLSKIHTPTINPIIQTDYEDEEDEEVNFGQFQQHYEDDSEDDIEINYQ